MKRLLIIYCITILPILSIAQTSTDSVSVVLLPRQVINELNLSNKQKTAMKEAVLKFKAGEKQRRKILHEKLLQVLTRDQLRKLYHWRKRNQAI